MEEEEEDLGDPGCCSVGLLRASDLRPERRATLISSEDARAREVRDDDDENERRKDEETTATATTTTKI